MCTRSAPYCFIFSISEVLTNKPNPVNPDVPFPSSQFTNAPLHALRQVPVCMVAVEGREERTSSNSNSNSASLISDNPKEVSASGRSSGGGYSFLNDAEAREVIAVVQALLAPGGGVASAADIGIVTPYNGQVSS